MAAADAASTEALLDGRYRLAECVGQGGMARVYRAEDLILGRTVAIKLIRPGVEGASAPERARSEMTVLASLNHPSLVTLFDARLVPGQPEYLVMEFVDGPTLRAHMADGPIASEEVGALAAELAEALHVVHSAGVVHRDIKPSNVLLSPAHLPGGRFRAKLADFGIACLLDGARVTSPGIVVGTAAYLAPEQARGAAPAPASDIYSLGLVLLEALTGMPAYPHSVGIESTIARLSTPPTIPDRLGPEWARLLAHMTDTDPAARPTALDVATMAPGLGRPRSSAPPLPLVPAAVAAAATASMTPTRPMRPGGLAAPADVALARRRGRRASGGVFGAAAAVAAGILAVGVWAGGIPGGGPEPAATVPAVTEPTTPADLGTDSNAEDSSGGAIPPADPGNGGAVDPDASKRAEEAQKRAEKALEEAGEQQEKVQEALRKQAEEAQKKAGEELEKQRESDDDAGEGD